jgi:hypothetical protein
MPGLYKWMQKSKFTHPGIVNLQWADTGWWQWPCQSGTGMDFHWQPLWVAAEESEPGMVYLSNGCGCALSCVPVWIYLETLLISLAWFSNLPASSLSCSQTFNFFKLEVVSVAWSKKSHLPHFTLSSPCWAQLRCVDCTWTCIKCPSLLLGSWGNYNKLCESWHSNHRKSKSFKQGIH